MLGSPEKHLQYNPPISRPSGEPGPRNNHAALPGQEQFMSSSSSTSLRFLSIELKIRKEEIRGLGGGDSPKM